MAKMVGPDCRQCRREGCKLFLKGERCVSKKCAFERRPVIPGQHGASRKRVTEYGTQLRETTEFLFQSGAKAVHVRPACPPLIHGCKYLNFSRSNSERELITRRVIEEREKVVTPEVLSDYTNPESRNYKEMEQCICKQMNFTSLSYNRLDDMIKATGIEPCKLCTYCFDGKE